tara:strand:- start:15626 stop:15820 length:195 start_codon:yes stop_codon:yes gene_type:complete
MEKVEQIREKVEALVNESIELLEANYNMDDAKYDNPAYMIMMNLNSALMELDSLDEEGLKTEEL